MYNKNSIKMFCVDPADIFIGINKNDFKNNTFSDDGKYYLTLCYLRKHCLFNGIVKFTINDMMIECGYSTHTRNQANIDGFKEMLKILEQNNFISLNTDIQSSSKNTLITAIINKNNNPFIAESPFITINISEFDKLTKTNTLSNKSLLISVFMAIKCYIFSTEQSSICQVGFPSIRNIRTAAHVSSDTTVNKAIKDLISLKLIYTKSDMYISDKNKNTYYPARNIYTLDKSYIENGVAQAELIHYYNMRGKSLFVKDELPKDAKIKLLKG